MHCCFFCVQSRFCALFFDRARDSRAYVFCIFLYLFVVKYRDQLVENGADIHPGANFVEDEQGRKIDLSKLSKERREALGQTLLTKTFDDDTNASLALSSGIGAVKSKKVWRHLVSGDVMLVNRQPTLHKASIMAHSARVLKQNEVVRMHYANCNSYNADFDGDEINLHFPQTQLGRAEG